MAGMVGKEIGNDISGNISGTRIPRNAIKIEPLIKSCKNCMFRYCLSLYFAPIKLNAINKLPPTNIQGNHTGIIIQ